MPLGMAAGSFSRGYEEQNRFEEASRAAAEDKQYQRGMEERKMQLAETSAAGEADLRKAKMDEIKRTAQKENFKETLMRFMTGDFRGGETAYNEGGDRRMVEGSARLVDDGEGNQMITWIDEESQQPVVVDPKFAMLITGLKPKDMETPEEAHTRAMELAKERAKGTAGGSTAEIRNTEYILANLTDDDGNKISKNEAWKMATTGKTNRARLAVMVRGQVIKMAKDNMEDLTAEEIDKRTIEAMNMIENNYGPKQKDGGKKGPPPKGQGGAAAFLPTPEQMAGGQGGGGGGDFSAFPQQHQANVRAQSGGMAGRGAPPPDDSGPVMGDMYDDEFSL